MQETCALKELQLFEWKKAKNATIRMSVILSLTGLRLGTRMSSSTGSVSSTSWQELVWARTVGLMPRSRSFNCCLLLVSFTVFWKQHNTLIPVFLPTSHRIPHAGWHVEYAGSKQCSVLECAFVKKWRSLMVKIQPLIVLSRQIYVESALLQIITFAHVKLLWVNSNLSYFTN